MNITIKKPSEGVTIMMTNATWFGEPEVSNGKVTGVSFTASHSAVKILHDKTSGGCCHEVGTEEIYVEIDGNSISVDGETVKEKLFGRSREAKSDSRGKPVITTKMVPKTIEMAIYERCGFDLYEFLKCNNALGAAA